MPKALLITGVGGFIGFHLAKRLLDNNLKVIGVLNDSNETNFSSQNRLSILKEYNQFKYYRINVCNKSKLEKLFKTEKLHGLIHLAAKVGVRESMTEPLEYAKTNIIGSLNLLDLASESKLEFFINASSSSIYNSENIPSIESEPINRIKSPYGVSKRTTELFTYNYHLKYDLNIINFRFFTVYGPAGRTDMSVHRFISQIDNGESIKVLGDGFQTRSFTYIDDIIDGILKGLNLKGFHTINLGNPTNYSIYDLIRCIEGSLNKKAHIIRIDSNYLDSSHTKADISTASNLLKWQPKYSLKEGIINTVEWYKRHKTFHLDIIKNENSINF